MTQETFLRIELDDILMPMTPEEYKIYTGNPLCMTKEEEREYLQAHERVATFIREAYIHPYDVVLEDEFGEEL